MAKRITAHSIVLHRAGKRILVKPNTEVDLSADELADIARSAPDALRKLPEASAAPAQVQLPAADGAKTDPKGGKNQGKGKQDEKPAETPAAAAADDL
jgi:hypothetical protein